ncbi:S1 RNA-binding domain-containing protein [Ureaplasma canigenitalium]|uniref:S1 RNA-binding domain-containing protein n=1 Tax=Ureaplasma canigenitalium TaxID=42092 RepID=UPI0004E199A4|nr:S1 RNA-binding domain-containing protein [Ureaplasma canigenitalium]
MNEKENKIKDKTNKQNPVDFKVVYGVIDRLTPEYAYIDLGNKIKGVCQINNLSEYSYEYIKSKFHIGSEYLFAIKEYDERLGIFFLNHKVTDPIEIKQKRRSYPTLSHARNLKKFVYSLINTEEKV